MGNRAYRLVAAPFRAAGRALRWLLPWLVLLPVWRRLLDWAGEVDERRAAARAARAAEAATAEEQAATDAGMTIEEYRWYVAEEAKAKKEQEEAEKQNRKAENQLRKDRSAALVAGVREQDFPAYKRHLSRYERMGRRGNLLKKELSKTMSLVRDRPPVIVRKYDSIPPLSDAQALFTEDAKVLAEFGYYPTSQAFVGNNVLTGYAIGAGTLTVSYQKR